MAIDSSDNNVRETRALAHELWGLCRDTSSQYQELTVDLRRLRNLLEDIEEHIAEHSSLDIPIAQISTPIMQCKAILCGLDLNLKSCQSLPEEQQRQNVQPEAILALKASVQVATHSLFVVFEAHVDPRRLDTWEASAPPMTTVAQPRSHSGVSRSGLSTATNVTLRVRNSARIISLPGSRPVGVAADAPSRQRIEDDDRESNQSPFGSRRAFTVPPMPADWHSPFSVPDPLAYDASRACTMLTDHHMRPATTVPRIVVNGCDAADDRKPNWTATAEECWSPKALSPTFEDVSTHASEKHYPETPRSTRHDNETRAGVACTMYVPYRPWYEPKKNVDSHQDMFSVQEHSDDRHEADPASTTTATTSPSVIVEEEAESSSPPMPIRSPPSLPLSQILRNKRKPPVPPRRRKKRSPTRKTSHMPVSLIVHTGARVVEDSISGLVKLPYLDELKHVLEGKPILKRNESTGESESHVATDKIPPTSIARSSIFRAQSMEVIAKPHIHQVEMRRTRSASAPELTTPLPRLSNVSHLFELPADSATAPLGLTHTAQVRTEESDATSHDPESLDPSMMLTRMDHICASWNNRYWAKAESYLTRHLTMVQHEHEIARKVRHLLGVCASYRGQWHRALAYFISVINKPVRELNQLDCGDKAAFYWLGDTYALLNWNEEALLAYCLAGSCDESVSASFSPRSNRCLLATQERLRQTVSKSSFKDRWTNAAFHNGHAPRGGILHCTVVTQPVAQSCLQSQGIASQQCSLHGAKNCSSDQGWDHTPVSDMLLIAPSHLESTSCWPLPHDPTFNFQGVLEGSPIAKHINIMNVLRNNPEALYFSLCFSPNLSGSHCVDLRRLITAVRESLQTLAMRWHEIVSRNGVFFLVQYDSVDGHIATMDYFRIEVTKFPLRNGFGLNFCSENTNRARRTSTFYHTNGCLDGATKKELKRCLRGAIESACARQTVAGPKSAGSLRSLSASLLRLPRVTASSSSAPTPPRESTESSISPAELETPQSTPQSSVDLSTLVPPIDPGMPFRARDRISVRSSYNERHLLRPLVR